MKRLLGNSTKRTNKRKVVFIDWNGTLSPTKFWSHLEKSEKQEERNLFKLWADTLFVKHKEKIVPWMKGEHTSEELLNLVAEETNTDYGTLKKEFIVGCQRMEFSSPDIPWLIQSLRDKSILVVIASNNMDCFTKWTVPYMKLRLLFDDILNSYDLRAMKHDLDKNGQTLFFRNFFSKYEVDPSDCIFIDDGEDKMNTISNLGIKYRRINTINTLQNELKGILGYL